MEVLVEVLREQSRLKMMDELWKVTVDNKEAVNIGDCPQAAVRGAAELTLRRGEEGGLRSFIDTTDVEENRWDHRKASKEESDVTVVLVVPVLYHMMFGWSPNVTMRAFRSLQLDPIPWVCNACSM